MRRAYSPLCRRAFLGAIVFVLLVASRGRFDLPKLPAADRFGDTLIDRLSSASEQKPVGFSHWTHRTRYTCRVCHFELGFAMVTNLTEITEEANRAGEYCGACHDGEVAFGVREETNCERCHNGGKINYTRAFRDLKALPRAPFGNEIDWSHALRQGLISPRASILEENFEAMPFTKHLVLEARWSMIPPAEFPHEPHNAWLDCANCHPDVFNIKKKTTEHFEMRFILEGKFCGVCHLNVAFPLDDCRRCHPSMKE